MLLHDEIRARIVARRGLISQLETAIGQLQKDRDMGFNLGSPAGVENGELLDILCDRRRDLLREESRDLRELRE